MYICISVEYITQSGVSGSQNMLCSALVDMVSFTKWLYKNSHQQCMSGPIIPHLVLFIFVIVAILEYVLQFAFETQRFGILFFVLFCFSIMETFNELVSIHSSGFCCLVPEQSTGLYQLGKM